jgi:glycosyltransferase involved in cell wall biosynthesis
MTKIKVVYIISDIEKSLNFEWTAQEMNKNKFELVFFLIGRRGSELAAQLNRLGVHVTEFQTNRKLSLVIIFFRIVIKLFLIKPEVVHTHLFRANILGLGASWLLRVPKRFFTRHHATVHYDEYPKGLKWDKFCNRIATHIIAISENVKNILINNDKADSRKIHLVHHGFILSYFKDVDQNRIQYLRKKYELSPQSYPVVGLVSRYLKLKGIQHAIPAFKEVREKYPNAHLILANTQGNYSGPIKSMLSDLDPLSFTEISFEFDLAALYKLFDVFVHVPIDAASEAFGQTYIEALASGVPSIFTLSGVAPEFIVDGYNALVVPFCDQENIAKAMERILNETPLRNHLIENGKESSNLFPMEKMILQLEQLYEQ